MMECLQFLPYWKDLTEDERTAMEKISIIRQFPQGSMVESADGSLGMIYVLKGTLRVYMLSEEGREISLYQLDKGDCCVLSASCVISQITFETHMEAMTDTDLMIVPSSLFSQLTEENIYVRCFMYELAAKRFSTVMWVMQQILFARFDQRLATFLLAQSRKTGKSEIRMTQEQIAEQVNSAREVVARMLKQFAADGLIEATRGVITIKDEAGLKELEI